MVIFATPDWAAGWAMQWLLIISAVVMVISVVGIVLGVGLLRSKSSAGRSLGGYLLLLVTCLLAICGYFAWLRPVSLENGTHLLGSYPNGKIQEGMCRDDVTAILGSPQQRDTNNGRETWIYLIDRYGERWFGVDFGSDGRVTHTYGN